MTELRLDSLLADAAAVAPIASGLASAVVSGDAGVEVSAVVSDSRLVTPGALFCCVPGAVTDGHDHAPAAVAAGASALLVERRVAVGAVQVQVPRVRPAMGWLSAAAAGWPARGLEVVGVTGTNGKTTTTHLIAAVLEAAGRSCAVLGTLGGARTTPEATDLQPELARELARGRDAVAMEVSSHALDQHRVDGTHFAVGCFTNLSPDHLDYHGDLESYFGAKARLFEVDLADHAVVVVDDEWGRRLAATTPLPVTEVSVGDADELVLGPTGSAFSLAGHRVELPLPGRFNVVNALVAAAAARILGVDDATIAAGLGAAAQVPGRFEVVEVGQPFTVVVDYAHTPDGLVALLDAVRELVGDARVITVFGCGGDRDRAKRPLMGAVVSERADVAVLTSDNPRSEDPMRIIDQTRAGMAGPAHLIVEPDRRAAIATALALARPGEVVVVAGKGHETTQTIGDEVFAFDDRRVAAAELEALGHGEVGS